MARILLVDDDPSTLALERLILTDAGHEVLIAHSGRVGLDLLKLYQVDLVIVDIMMPELNGFQFVNLIRNSPKTYQASIAFLTSVSNKQDILRAGEMGADFYMMKPIDREDFLKKISHFLEKNPPKEHSQIQFHKTLSAEMKVTSGAQIVSISDIGMEILTDSCLEVDQVLELSTSLFHEIPLKNPLVCVLSCFPDSNHGFRVRLMFIDQDIENVHRLQRWISYNKLKRRQA